MQEPNQVLTQRTSPAPSYISASPGPSELPPKRQRKEKNEIDDALLALTRNAQERRLMRERKEAEKRNPETHYGLEIAETLNRFTPYQKALAKLKIQQVLLEIEFPNSS